MEECLNHAGDYLTHECHKKLKYYFHKKIIIYDDTEKEIKEAISTMTYKPHDTTSIYPILKQIGIFFTGDNAFVFSGRKPSCIYVNYWLNNELRNLHYYEDKYEFKIFKEFADKFTVVRGRNVDNSCSSYMKYYNEDKWKRIKILYVLYDEFEKFISPKINNKSLKCYEIIFLREIFNDFINKNDGEDDELMDKLIKFKEMLRTKVLHINGNCLADIGYFKSPTIYLDNKQKLGLAAQQKREAEAQREREAEAQKERVRAEQERARTEQESARIKQEPARIKQEPASTEQEPEGAEQAAKEAQLIQVPQTPKQTQDELQVDLLIPPYYPETKLSEDLRLERTQANRIDLHLHESEDTRSTFPSGEGIIDSIKGTFNSIVENVEPAPVLGVSGGMGVLFLLFKVLKIFKS
ncbi:hypothetical protein PVIIG_05666 [Plasmodium vivax India VII]|uniref:Uncharacterized protein n=1 Tax=Plasmodium vivax India VII TaxID=1077284 RepID=A0A0J9SIS5_PLAVI|nr:hypothetical protein PVIIG_05666 [Plasmodium vivax India VII]